MYGEAFLEDLAIPFIGPQQNEDDQPDDFMYGAPTSEEDGTGMEECVDPAADPISIFDAFSHFTEDFLDHFVYGEREKSDAKRSGTKFETGNGFETKAEQKTEDGKDHVKGGASVKVTDSGGEGSLEIGGGSHQVDHAKEEERQKKENAEYLEFLKKKERGEVPQDAKFKPSDEAKEKPAPGSSTKVKTTGGWDAETGGHGGAGAERDTTNADGSKTKTSAGVKYSEGPDGPSVSVEGGVSRKDADGKTKPGGGAGVEVNKDGVVVKANAEIDKGGANVEITSKDGEDGIKGGAKGGTDAVKFSLSGGYVVKFSAPAKLPGGKYAVTYTITKDVGGSVSASDPKGAGMKVGGSASLSDKTVVSVTKVFGSEEEALAFRKAESVGERSFPESAAQVATMKAGEKFVLTESNTQGVDASAGGQYGSAGAGASSTTGERTSVEMNADHSVFAERTATVDETGKLSYTAPGGLAGISGANTTKKTVRTRIKVDLGSEENPNQAGRDAYNAFIASGIVSEPAQVVSRTTSDGKQTGREINLGPVKGFEISEVTESVTYDEDGKLEESTGERQRGWEIKMLGLKGKYGTKLEAIQRNDDDAKRAYMVTSTVEQQSAYDSMRRLNDVAGGGIRGEEELQGMKASGKWEVQSAMDPAAVDQFVAQVQKGNYNPQLVTDKDGKVSDSTKNYFAAGDDLKKALKEAGADKDKQRQALAQFVADGGEDAVAQMKALGGADNEVFVTLRDDKDKVDPNFRGIEGRLEMESLIARLQARAEKGNSDPQLLLTEIKAASANVRTRINTITPERYPDLPPGVMATEIGRSRKDLERLDALAAPLRSAVNDQRLAKLTPEERASREKQTELEAELSEISGGGGGKVDPALRQAAKMKQMATAKAAAEKERTAARAAQKKHTGAGYKSTSRRPRDRIADSDDRWAQLYTQADAEVSAGHATFLTACAQETMAFAMPENSDENIDTATGVVGMAIDLFTAAKSSFTSGIASYSAIATGNPNDELNR
ncbi:MAG: hypothetical protein AB7T06_22870 [Kofleriaceae bacterium]